MRAGVDGCKSCAVIMVIMEWAHIRALCVDYICTAASSKAMTPWPRPMHGCKHVQ